MLTRLKIYLLILVSFLALFGLGNTYFWEDEARNAIDARQFLQSGEFTSWGGRHLSAFPQGTRYEENLNSIDPPLPPVLAASGFAVFGFDTFAGWFPKGIQRSCRFTLLSE